MATCTEDRGEKTPAVPSRGGRGKWSAGSRQTLAEGDKSKVTAAGLAPKCLGGSRNHPGPAVWGGAARPRRAWRPWTGESLVAPPSSVRRYRAPGQRSRLSCRARAGLRCLPLLQGNGGYLRRSCGGIPFQPLALRGYGGGGGRRLLRLRNQIIRVLHL